MMTDVLQLGTDNWTIGPRPSRGPIMQLHQFYAGRQTATITGTFRGLLRALEHITGVRVQPIGQYACYIDGPLAIVIMPELSFETIGPLHNLGHALRGEPTH
jgi:hypothetical protein